MGVHDNSVHRYHDQHNHSCDATYDDAIDYSIVAGNQGVEEPQLTTSRKLAQAQSPEQPSQQPGQAGAASWFPHSSRWP